MVAESWNWRDFDGDVNKKGVLVGGSHLWSDRLLLMIISPAAAEFLADLISAALSRNGHIDKILVLQAIYILHKMVSGKLGETETHSMVRKPPCEYFGREIQRQQRTAILTGQERGDRL